LISLSLFRPTSLSKPPFFHVGQLKVGSHRRQVTFIIRVAVDLDSSCICNVACRAPLLPLSRRHSQGVAATPPLPKTLQYLEDKFTPAFPTFIFFSSNSPRGRTILPRSPLVTVLERIYHFQTPLASSREVCDSRMVFLGSLETEVEEVTSGEVGTGRIANAFQLFLSYPLHSTSQSAPPS